MRFGGFVAVDSVDLDVHEGQIHALVGPNGAGKSTLLNVLGGQLMQTSGEIHFLGRSLGKSRPHQRARLGIGRSFQLTSIVPGFSCLENVVLAVEARHRLLSMLRPRTAGEDVERAHELLAIVGLRDSAQVPADVLGHGRQKQLEVAMALGGNPRLLLLDEPASGLTLHERQTLGALLERVAERATIVVAEHDVGLVRRVATWVTALSVGRKVAEGAAEAVFQAPEVRQVFLRGESSA
jgi:branched-chain amino acid transport system ATP-binding protein